MMFFFAFDWNTSLHSPKRAYCYGDTNETPYVLLPHHAAYGTYAALCMSSDNLFSSARISII